MFTEITAEAAAKICGGVNYLQIGNTGIYVDLDYIAQSQAGSDGSNSTPSPLSLILPFSGLPPRST